jgi:hypothetical protein
MVQKYKKHRFRGRRRVAISEVIATIVLVAVTVTIGSIVWVWANSNAVNSENSYFNVTAEKLEIVASTFSSTSGSAPWTNITLYAFNSGEKNTTTAAILITYPATGCTGGTCSLSVAGSAIGVKLPMGVLTKLPSIILTVPVPKGTIVSVVITGQYGTNYDYQVTG